MAQSKIPCAHAQSSGLIGLDFGSTRSAVAITLSAYSEGSEFRFIPKFETALSVIDLKTPVLRFVPPVVENGGFPKLKLFKALLVERPSNMAGDPSIMKYASKCITDLGINLPENHVVVGTFLKGLWNEALTILNAAFPKKALDDPHVVITYPGNWNPREVEMLRKAAAQAGIEGEACQTCGHGVTYRTEQEAAVYAALVDHHEKLLDFAKRGDSIIVADCGGQTIDAALFKFHPFQGQENSRSVGEIEFSESSLNGALAIDCKILNAINEQLRTADLPHGQARELSFAEKENLNIAWGERFKTRFSQRDPYNETFVFWTDTRYEIRINRDTILGIFETQLQAVAEHISSLYNSGGKKARLAIITGGFSQSPMLQNRIHHLLETKLQTKSFNVIISSLEKTQTSVCRGAALTQLPLTFLEGE